jgi:hypothetical protein
MPLAIAQRVRERVFGYVPANLSPSPAVNNVLFRLFRTERAWIPRRHFPFGLSLMAIARRGEATRPGRARA